MDAMTWTNVCNATVSLDGNHMSGIWMQQDHRQMVIQRSRATGRFEAVKIRQPHELYAKKKRRRIMLPPPPLDPPPVDGEVN